MDKIHDGERDDRARRDRQHGKSLDLPMLSAQKIGVAAVDGARPPAAKRPLRPLATHGRRLRISEPDACCTRCLAARDGAMPRSYSYSSGRVLRTPAFKNFRLVILGLS